VSRRVRIALAVAFVLATAVLLAWFKLHQPRILILHSYDPEYAWTRDINVGLHRELDSKLRYQVHWHYMNTKNNPDEGYARRAGVVARRALDTLKPDLVIAVDDDAQEYVVQDLVNDPHIAIVFAGINGAIEPYGYDKAKNVTGILERKPLHDLRDSLAAMRLRGAPLGRRLLILGDRSGSVLADVVEIEQADWKPFRLAGTRLADNFEEWQAAVRDAPREADAIIVTNYRRLYRDASRTERVPAAEVVRWTEENSKLPLVGIAGSFVEDGGMFALGASGFEQGNVVGRMAIRILERQAKPGDIPVQQPRQFIVYMRRHMMHERGVELPTLYESFARATNNYLD